jgi:hypothetical protein
LTSAARRKTTAIAPSKSKAKQMAAVLQKNPALFFHAALLIFT